MTSPPLEPEHKARQIMEAVAELHARGYGRLKLFCYIKEGLNAWRHFLFAPDSFPSMVSDLPPPIVAGSLPEWPVVSAAWPSAAADELVRERPELMAAAAGRDEVYEAWYRQMLCFPGWLEMESPDEARMSGVGRIPTPYPRRRA